MEIKKDLSPNFTPEEQTEDYYGEPRTFQYIVLHWWGDPEAGYTFDGTVDYLKNPDSNVSAHYVVSEDKITQLVELKDTAWHARDANPKSIGIEIDPQFSDKTYETVGWLINYISKQTSIPITDEYIVGHRKFVATQCPGTLDFDRVINLALGTDNCQDKLDKLQDDFIDMKIQRDRKDVKLEECRNERVELKNENQKIVENYDKQIKGLQSDLAGVRLEVKDKTECITSLEEDKNALELNVGDLEDTLADNHQNYVDLEEKYQKCKEKIKDPVKNMSIFEFILHKLGR